MAKAGTRLGNATFVERGYGQVEPNHLSAPQNGQVYAQLPAAGDIDILENGQFVKYNYVKGVCDFDTSATAGAWMMVFNEVKIYRDREGDADFAMIKSNYNARVYSPIGQNTSTLKTIVNYGADGARREGTDTPFATQMETFTYPQLMPKTSTGGKEYDTKMVPRVLRISIGDIWTTNTIKADAGSLAIGDTLKIGADGYLTKNTTDDTAAKGGDLDPIFAVVKVYTMPDLQPGVKIQRVA